MSPKPLNSDGETDKHKTREQLLTELMGLRDIIKALETEQAGCDRIIDMLDGITEPLLLLDDLSQIIYANSSAGRLFDVRHEELAGKRLWDVYPKSKDTLFYNVFIKAAANRSPASFIEKHSRQARWFEVYLYPVAGGIVILFQDITTRRHKDELQRLALVLLHHLKENIFLLRADGRLFHVNDETRHSLGYSTGELTHMSIFDLLPQAYLGQWHDILDRIKQRGSAAFESVLRAKDGREFPVDVYANYIELYGHDYYTISARDITERKIADEKIGDARARAEMYLDLMGHDIRNQTMITAGNIEMAIGMLAGSGKLDPDGKACLENAINSLESTTLLINNVQKLQLTTTEMQKLQRMDVCEVLESVIDGVKALSARDMDIRYLPCPGCVVNANELLKDVFVNLIGNAIKHSPPGRPLIIDVLASFVNEGGEKQCKVTIADNGPGIPDWLKARLFQRFARGKTDVHGSGLGLYLVRTLLEQYGGSIQAEDRVSGDYTKGVKFVVTIPAAE
jgi:PAS domain S-box-containing protein